ncbi:MAG: iron chelate uptake ABC transporter family permease subunit, partial [Nanobdellota archaeon]
MSESASLYKRSVKSKAMIIALLFFLVVLFAFISISVGSTEISFQQILSSFFGSESTASQIIMNIRMPRVIAAVLSGLALAMSGVVMQNVLRNPLASPFTLGVSHAAAFG